MNLGELESAARALVAPGKGIPAAKEAFLLRAKLNGAARRGSYSPTMEPAS